MELHKLRMELGLLGRLVEERLVEVWDHPPEIGRAGRQELEAYKVVNSYTLYRKPNEYYFRPVSWRLV